MTTKQLRKPLTLYLAGFGYLASAVFYGVEGFRLEESFYPHHLAFMALYPVCAYGIIRVRRWGWFLVIGHIGGLLLTNAILAIFFSEFTLRLFVEMNLLFIFFLWFFLRRSVRSPFHNPALRWWERQYPRFGLEFDATLRDGAGSEFHGAGINISLGGCFVKLEGADALNKGDVLDIELAHAGDAPFTSRCRVMWLAEPGGDNPRGAGVEFIRPTRTAKKLLRGIIETARGGGGE